MDTIDFRAIVQQLPSSSMWTRSTGAPISGYAALVGEHPHRDDLRLPRIESEALRPGEGEPEPAVEPGSGTILLVEDEDVVRTLACRVLERSGYTVLACGDGAEAIGVAERHERPIHLLLTDVVMPGLRGHEVAAHVSASRPEIKVLYMSGYADEALLGPMAIAHDVLIEKPFAVDNLTRRVRQALETTPVAAR